MKQTRGAGLDASVAQGAANDLRVEVLGEHDFTESAAGTTGGEDALVARDEVGGP